MEIVPKVVIIILNWNGYEDTIACLASLRDLDFKNYQILVVDNGSTDNSVQIIRDMYPAITILENDRNYGYAGGNNIGLRWALDREAEYVLLLNNDTEVSPDSVRRMVEVAEADTSIGITGPTVYYHSNPSIIWSAGGQINWRTGATYMIGINEPNSGQFGNYPREVDFINGCALLTKRAVLESIGLLDERFFVYYEEAEWCVRAKRAGFRILHIPQASIWHKISPNTQMNSPLVLYYMTRNRLLFIKTTRMKPSAWLITIFGDYLRTLFAWSLKPHWRHKRPLRRVMLRAIFDALRSHWGYRAVI